MAARVRPDDTFTMRPPSLIRSSAFHRQFKFITSMTPLQYQKQLRLLEARRPMLAEEVNVETAAFPGWL